MNNMFSNDNQIKTVFSFILFIVILCSVFCRISWLFRSNNAESREDIYAFRNQGSVDVVFYGGSNLLRYYQPLEAWKKKGYTSYNYATSSARADLLKEYIEESRVSNEAILYVCDIRTFPWVKETVEDSSLRNWSDSLPVFSPIRWEGVSSFLFSRNRDGVDILSYYLDIIKYHTNMDALKSDYQWSYQNLNLIYNLDKGFDPNKQHISFEKPRQMYNIGILTYQQEKSIDDLLDYCDSNKLNVLFICCPSIIEESDWLTLNAVGKKIIDRGYTYINFNYYYDEIGLDFETDFGDINHVNYLGAEKYTNYLMDYISENYNLPDHRNDSNYRQWNDDYEMFKVSQTEWKNAIVSLVESDMNAKIVGKFLSEKKDFYDWYSDIRDPNFSVIIMINEMPVNINMRNPLYQFMEDYDIDHSYKTYIGVWEGDKSKLSMYDESNADFSIGVDGGRGVVPCTVDLELNKVIIGETNYSIYGDGIQVLVFDNKYQQLDDNVLLCVNSDDTVEIRRP